MELHVQEGGVAQRGVGAGWPGVACAAIRSGGYVCWALGRCVLRYVASVMASPASAGRRCPKTGGVKQHAEECRKGARHRGRIGMTVRACGPGRKRNVHCGVDGHDAWILSLMACRADGTRRMGKRGPQEGGITDVAGIAGVPARLRQVPGRVDRDDIRILVLVAGAACAGDDAGMRISCTQECRKAGVAGDAIRRDRNRAVG